MTSDPALLNIGDFARAVGLPASALRHYDECGLLVPARTDAATGYRYYTPALEQRARLVATMREVGVPIDTMRVVLDGSATEARASLDALGADREEQALRTREVLRSVLAVLDTARHPGVARLRVDGPALAAALRQVRPAADTEPGSALASVLLDVGHGAVDVVATNRFWMACRTVPGRLGSGSEARAVLPLAGVPHLVERLEAVDEPTLVLSDGRLSLEDRDDLASVPTTDRPFPAHRLVLAGVPEPVTTAVVDREAVLSAVGRAGRSLVDVRCGPDGLDVAGTPLGGAVRGAPVAIRFRAALLLRAVTSCVGPRVRLRFTADPGPVALGSPDQPGYVALLMPTFEP